jgi:alpha-L-rhamnosidase
VQPRPGGGLIRASARHDTPYGSAEVAWTRQGSRLNVVVTVPPNCAADVVLPHSEPVTVGSGRHDFDVVFPAAALDPIRPLPPRASF